MRDRLPSLSLSSVDTDLIRDRLRIDMALGIDDWVEISSSGLEVSGFDGLFLVMSFSASFNPFSASGV